MSSHRFRFVATLLGALLIFAAVRTAGSALGLSGSSAPPPKGHAVALNALQILAEFFVGAWLVCCCAISPMLLWRIAMAMFVCFASVSLYRAAQGYGSCGCFGNAQLSPWYSLAIDAACIAALLISRPITSEPRASAVRTWASRS